MKSLAFSLIAQVSTGTTFHCAYWLPGTCPTVNGQNILTRGVASDFSASSPVIYASSYFSDANNQCVGRDFGLLKITGSGTPLFLKCYGGTSTDDPATVLLSPSGEILMVGNTRSFGPSTPTYSNLLLLFLDASGNVLSSHLYYSQYNVSTNLIDEVRDAVVTSAHIWLTGYVEPVPFRSTEAFLARMDVSSGQIQWARFIGSSTNNHRDEFRFVLPLRSGRILTIGGGGTAGADRILLVKWDSVSGNPVVIRVLNDPGFGVQEFAMAGAEAPYGIYITGWVQPGPDAFLIRVDTQNLNILWAYRYSCGGLPCPAFSVIYDPMEDAIVMAGNDYRNSPPNLTYLLKVDPITGDVICAYTYGGGRYGGSACGSNGLSTGADWNLVASPRNFVSRYLIRVNQSYVLNSSTVTVPCSGGNYRYLISRVHSDVCRALQVGNCIQLNQDDVSPCGCCNCGCTSDPLEGATTFSKVSWSTLQISPGTFTITPNLQLLRWTQSPHSLPAFHVVSFTPLFDCHCSEPVLYNSSCRLEASIFQRSTTNSSVRIRIRVDWEGPSPYADAGLPIRIFRSTGSVIGDGHDPVPVLLPVSAWNPELPLEVVDTLEDVSHSSRGWVAYQVIVYTPDYATRLCNASTYVSLSDDPAEMRFVLVPDGKHSYVLQMRGKVPFPVCQAYLIQADGKQIPVPQRCLVQQAGTCMLRIQGSPPFYAVVRTCDASGGELHYVPVSLGFPVR